VQQPAAPDLRDSQSRFLTRQGAKIDQPAHEVLRDVRALGDLSDPVRHQDAASSIRSSLSPNPIPQPHGWLPLKEQPQLAE
jgi:hypothetical protein